MSCIEGSLRASATTDEEDAAYKEQQRRAALTVARYARTLKWRERRKVCGELLDMLGLVPEQGDEATKEAS